MSPGGTRTPPHINPCSNSIRSQFSRFAATGD
nr:MAG TPA: JmjC domain, hydroxylase [Caudoviricetes sp.]DAK19823.1 MAG TPA: JmjC domain, hydroxylase [Caudoviricetes sp.]DAM95378.1 MAG TPA: JmjC domain, hydroxylase [Caudoviricetes sp.]DAR91336.1 MAG TPA: JmjC domain, hydroxylase [Caudoviricetes sp.]DAS67079.1 MAG TPA: JmjC domain, hydroxylase [Caudoviricetes sp.]